MTALQSYGPSAVMGYRVILGSATGLFNPPEMECSWALCRLTRNPHHRNTVLSPPTVWHHSVFPFLDLCLMPAEYPWGNVCSYNSLCSLTFQETNSKQLREVRGVSQVLFLILSVVTLVTDAFVWRNARINPKFCNTVEVPQFQCHNSVIHHTSPRMKA